MAAIDDVKLMLGLEANFHRDDVINIIISSVQSHLKVLISKTEIPSELNFVVTEIAVTRYNRLGGEGYESESVEGHSITYNTNDFGPFMNIIDKFIETPDVKSEWEFGEVKTF